jgi:ribonuclease Z
MDTRNSHWKQKWVIPKLKWTIRGYSRAAYRTGFYIEELNILLDAGNQSYNTPKHIFITHTHGDHIANLPFTLINPEINSDEFVKPIIYGPEKARKHINNYITALFTTNAMSDSQNLITQASETYTYKGYETAITDRINIKNTDYDLQIFICDHGISTVSYGFSSISNKLKHEFLGKTGIEIKTLRQSGTQITEEVPTKKFAYICDTSIKVLETHPEILDYPVVFIECTFLYPDELDNATKTKHIHWFHLRNYVINHPDTTFVLIHFSLRYTDQEILAFFGKEMWLYDIDNIKVWAGDTKKELEPIEPDFDKQLDIHIFNLVDQIIETVILETLLLFQ